MSDCANQSGYDALMLRIEFEGEEIPWMYPLALNGRSIRGVYVDGERYERGVCIAKQRERIGQLESENAELRASLYNLTSSIHAAKQDARIEQLESLARDMWPLVLLEFPHVTSIVNELLEIHDGLRERMTALGLLEGDA